MATDATGYDPRFLSAHVPLPLPSDDRDIRTLDYPRFTVSLDPVRRLAIVTGVNIDGATLRDLPRTGEWELDGRIPAGEQAGPELYARNDLDRGHLVRRRDPGWGDAAEARVATEATFRYPNAAPQWNAFNQSKELWVGLEDHVLAYAEAFDRRVSVFTAPVLAEGDPVYRGVAIPLRFWKVAAWIGEGGRLRSAGFLLDQSGLMRLEDTPTAIPDLAGFRTFQIPVSEIAGVAGVAFGPLVDADVASATPGARATAWIELSSPADIRL